MDRAGQGDRDKAQTLLDEALESYTQIRMPCHSECLAIRNAWPFGMPGHIEMTQTFLD
jgi:hypothetical protein